MTSINKEIANNNCFNIVDILLIDHAYLKECIAVLTNDYAHKNEKIFFARTFLDTLKKHSESEEKTVYESLSEMDDLRKLILEGDAEHGMARFKYETLIPKLQKMKTLDDSTEAEIKVLAELIEHHIDEEETELFPKMRRILDSGILNEIGFQFIILRKFTPQDLKDHPKLQAQIYQKTFTDSKKSRKNIYQWSENFVKKVNRYISSLIVQVPTIKNNNH